MNLADISKLSDDELRVKVAESDSEMVEKAMSDYGEGKALDKIYESEGGDVTCPKSSGSNPPPDVQAEGRGESFEHLVSRYLEWVRITFPGETVHQQYRHLLEEFDELSMSPDSAPEYADVLMLLICVSNGKGIDLIQEFRDKFELNQKRTWQNTEKGFRHVKVTNQEIHKPHNPDNLQSPGEGYRFLDEDEIQDGPILREIGIWALRALEWLDGNSGWDKSRTYRTHLTREELAKKRKEGM